MSYTLSESDVIKIKSMYQRINSLQSNQGGYESRIDLEEQQAPEVYIAKTPTTGISSLLSTLVDLPGRNPQETGSGTVDLNSLAGDSPGFAYCTIYRVIPHPVTDDPELYPVSTGEVTVKVHNFSQYPIEGDKWILVIRDKAGTWWGLWNVTDRQFAKGTLDTTLLAGASAMVSVYERNHLTGSEYITGEKIRAWDWFMTGFQTLASGKKVILHRDVHTGIWYVVSAAC